MKRRSFYVFLAASLAMLIPAPGRFVYGGFLILELNLLMLIGTLTSFLLEKMKLNEIVNFVTMLVVVAFTVIYKLLLNIWAPEVSLTLGFVIYLIPVSIFFTGYLYLNQNNTLKERLKLNMVHILTFSIYAFLFFLFRDLLGYGTFTYVGFNHEICEIILISPDKVDFFSILASIPGALVLSSIILTIHIFFRNKFNILRNAEVAE